MKFNYRARQVICLSWPKTKNDKRDRNKCPTNTQHALLFYLFPSAARGQSNSSSSTGIWLMLLLLVQIRSWIDSSSLSNVEYGMEWVLFTADKTRPDGCRPPTSTAAGWTAMPSSALNAHIPLFIRHTQVWPLLSVDIITTTVHIYVHIYLWPAAADPCSRADPAAAVGWRLVANPWEWKHVRTCPCPRPPSLRDDKQFRRCAPSRPARVIPSPREPARRPAASGPGRAADTTRRPIRWWLGRPASWRQASKRHS